MNQKVSAIPNDYADWLTDIKTRVTAARQRAALAANAELVQLYWQIGNELLQRQQSAHWGDKVLDRLASDLREAFPGMKGFSSRNLKYMRYFAEHCPEQAFGQQPAARMPWFGGLMDLLFYHTRLKCYVVVVELKAIEDKSEGSDE